ncbi:hypothetical protein KR044_002323 [Drosophila immigrans]|nr:hypothetical protein KR044_002323 [Drosophila immigrans]
MKDDTTFVVTGVRFQVLDGHLNLKVHFSKFDFVKGELVEPEINRIWQSEDSSDERPKLNLENLDLPTLSKIISSKIILKKKLYVEFVNTEINSDVAQATVPFIDIQDVVSVPPIPLVGIGLFHKGEGGFGGFLSPEIINYNITSYIPVPTIPPT